FLFKNAEKRPSFIENTPPRGTTAGCLLSNSPHSRDLLPVRFGELPDSSKVRCLTSSSPVGANELLNYVVQTVHQLNVRLERDQYRLNFLTAETLKRRAEDFEIAASCTDFRLPLASEVVLMQPGAKLQEGDKRVNLVTYHFESHLFSGAFVFNLRWSALCRSGSSYNGESYLGNFRTQLQTT
ncbi:hypothetical protein P879_10019, partial [Paragonimus westermani]